MSTVFFRHTTAHILAQAVKRLYPNTKCAIGPAIVDGFYYDFEFDFEFSADRFEEIEKEMKKIVKENLQLRHYTMSREKALQLMKENNEPYKVQLIEDLPEGEELSFYQQGEYVELCAGPHVAYTSAVKAFKLLAVAGAYWRGNEKNKMLTRIYGTSFPNKEMLEEYLNRMEEAKKRDHRKLGKELGLFAMMDEGPGFPFFLPKGMVLKNLLIDYWRKLHTREGYVEISTPMMSIGSDEDWEVATAGLKNALDDLGLAYVINEGDGAFYGPKIDFHLEDSIGRTWQCGTIQLDFQLPQRFDAQYIGVDGEKHRPIMIHRVVFGSIERFIGILIEHFAGKFPLWLSPVQVKVLSISDKYNDYAGKVMQALQNAGFRCEIDTRDEKIGYKIRSARNERVPYILVVGEKEAESNSVSVRSREEGDLGCMSINQLQDILQKDKNF